MSHSTADEPSDRGSAASETGNPETAPLGMKAMCVLVGIVAVTAFLQGVYYLWRAELVVSSAGLLLMVVAVADLYVARGLWNCEQWAWYAGLGLFGGMAAFAVVRVVLFADVFATAEFFLNGAIALYVYRKRPYYDPSMPVDERVGLPLVDRVFDQPDPEGHETAPLGVKAIVLLAGFVALVAFFQGSYYVWHPGDDVTMVGFTLVVLAAVQGYVLYGLWYLERWAWFGAIALFGGAAVLAVIRILLFNDSVATIEFLVDGLTAFYLYHQKEWYAPDITVDVLPE